MSTRITTTANDNKWVTMTCYTVAFQKGGSTKTTTAAEIVAALVKAGRRVLAIDLDEQGDFSSRLGVTQSTEVECFASIAKKVKRLNSFRNVCKRLT